MEPQALQRPHGVRRGLLLIGFAVGLFVAGLISAFLVVPEWMVRSIGSEEAYKRHFQKTANSLNGIGLLPEAPRVDLISFNSDLPTVYQQLGKNAPTWLVSEGRPFMIGISQSATDSLSRRGRLFILMSTRGRPWFIDWSASEFAVSARARDTSRYEPMVQALLRPEEQGIIVPPGPIDEFGTLLSLYKVLPSHPPQFIFATSVDVYINAFRQNVKSSNEASDRHKHQVYHILRRWLPEGVIMLGALALMIGTLVRRHRLAWRKGLLLSLVTLTSALLIINAVVLSFAHLLDFVAYSIYQTVLIFLLWSAAESLLLSGSVGAVPGLSSLLTWKPTPRGGSQVLIGAALGMAAAGVHLLFASLTTLIPGVYPSQLSILLQNSNFDQNPFYSAILLAALVLLSEALSRTQAAQRLGGSLVVAFVLSTLLLSNYSPRGPWIFAFVSTLPIAGLLLVSFRRLGIGGLLTACVTLMLLPLAVFAAVHWGWLSLTLSTTAGTLIVLLGAGIMALSMPPPNRPIRLFLSYAHEDIAAAQSLKEVLHDLPGISFWWDREIKATHDYNHVIAEELRGADVFVALISNSFLRSDYCKGIEIREATRRNRIGELRMIPVIIEDAPWKALDGLPEIQAIELLDNNWASIRAGIEDVINEIQQERELSRRPAWLDSLVSW
jgi:hypothetical protein